MGRFSQGRSLNILTLVSSDVLGWKLLLGVPWGLGGRAMDSLALPGPSRCKLGG